MSGENKIKGKIYMQKKTHRGNDCFLDLDVIHMSSLKA